MTSNVGAKVIEGGGRNFGFFLRPDDEESEQDMSYNRIKSLVSMCGGVGDGLLPRHHGEEREQDRNLVRQQWAVCGSVGVRVELGTAA